ncbi:putative F-box domain-containing protein [Heracleum sosnowskyi]|uniref:F-box domain-containing protein n=1 Tax=Heracleum sosnowskyi TaxID=360622 RepID=A0AAD8N0S7_9APIA|nr:putative F-box domain-containing protein [Heracleum sosnowskyi]
MDEIPLCIMFNIFSRIPPKSLLQLRCVSKSWLKIIDDPFLCHMHIHCGSVELQTPLFLPRFTNLINSVRMCAAYDSEDDRMIYAGRIPMAELNVDGFCAFGSCNGLLYFAGYYCDEKIFVSNPLRNQFRALPPIYFPPTDDFLALMKYSSWSRSKHPEESPVNAYGLGFDSSTNTFKMVCTLQNTGECKGTVVHNLGTNSWRKISSVPQYPIYGKPVFVHGFLHWLLSPLRQYYGDLPVDNTIISFDICKEKFELLPHPGIWSKNMDEFRLIDCNGHFRLFDRNSDLGVADISMNDKDIDIWVMDHVKKEWSKVYNIRLTQTLAAAYNDVCIYAIACIYNDNDIGMYQEGQIFLKSYKGYWIFSTETGGLRFKQISGLSNGAAQILSHTGSLVLI